MSDLYGEELVDRLKYFDFARGEETMLLGKIPTLLARSGWSPELGYEIYLEDASYGNELYDLVWEHGYKYGIKPGAPNQQRRIEGGMLSFGADTLQDTNALELGLSKKFVNPYGKHDFIGKQALQQIAEDGGPHQKLYGIVFDSHEEDEDVEVLSQAWCGKHLGVFTDKGASQNPYGVFTAFISHSPQFGRALGFAFLPNDTENIGSSVFIETSAGTRVRGSVCSLPFTSRVA
jgi:aminomethyltransferase